MRLHLQHEFISVQCSKVSHLGFRGNTRTEAEFVPVVPRKEQTIKQIPFLLPLSGSSFPVYIKLYTSREDIMQALCIHGNIEVFTVCKTSTDV